MTKEYVIRTNDVASAEGDDCYLDPSDPLYQMTTNLLTKNRKVAVDPPIETWEDRYAREHNIKPGTPAWFALRQPK